MKNLEHHRTWFVTKRGAHPYNGPSWQAINEKPRFFKEATDAAFIAGRLTEYNPVGFSIRQIPSGFQAGEYPKINALGYNVSEKEWVQEYKAWATTQKIKRFIHKIESIMKPF